MPLLLEGPSSATFSVMSVRVMMPAAVRLSDGMPVQHSHPANQIPVFDETDNPKTPEHFGHKCNGVHCTKDTCNIDEQEGDDSDNNCAIHEPLSDNEEETTPKTFMISEQTNTQTLTDDIQNKIIPKCTTCEQNNSPRQPSRRLENNTRQHTQENTYLIDTQNRFQPLLLDEDTISINSDNYKPTTATIKPLKQVAVVGNSHIKNLRTNYLLNGCEVSKFNVYSFEEAKDKVE
ncbi:unnamed protein product [Mytilus edulis]|uniref:Uncharacterized protein n=1 Tax=Mytilus edulis TaxID=6550 RepID=A0A8S3T6L8_MYTED|nr:unnamed protein product [Mytilus edulis]